MHQLHSSKKTPNSLSTNKKLSAEVNKSPFKPSPGRSQITEAQKTNINIELEKCQLATKTPVKALSSSYSLPKQSTALKSVTSSSPSRKRESKSSLKPPVSKPESKRILHHPPSKPESKPILQHSARKPESKSGLKPPASNLDSKSSLKPPSRFAQRLLVSKQQRVFLSQEEIQQLTSKFEALSEIIVHLATSNSPISVRSLESLLTKEVENCLGSAINSAKFAEVFVRETRRLLCGLNCKFEEGKVHTQLIKGVQRPYLRANSAATACYRDRYLKELVMNVLQEMCSMTEIGDVACPVDRRRVHDAVRGLVNAKAGVEPEVLQRVERGIDQLQKSLSHNQCEVRSASREIDKLISEHQMRQTADPELANETEKNIKKSSYKAEYATTDKGLAIDGSLKESFSKNLTDTAKNCHGVGDDHQPLETTKTKPLNLVSDTIQSMRPEIEQIVQGEICRARQKKEAVLNSLKKGLFQDSRNDSGCGIGSETAMFDDSDDEIDAEETLLFLEALSADATHNMVNRCITSSNCTLLENSGEGYEEDIEDKEVPHFHVRSCERPIVNFVEECKFCNKCETIEPTLEETVTWVEPDIHSYKLNHKNSMPIIAEETSDEICSDEDDFHEKNLSNVTSVWWSEEDTEAQDIIRQIKNSFNTFDRLENDSIHVHVSTKTNHNVSDNPVKSFSNWFMNGVDFTVEEISHILTNISKKVHELPLCTEKSRAYFNETHDSFTNSQRVLSINILNLLENSLDGLALPDNNSNSFKTDYQLEDEDKLTATKNRLSTMFKTISETLSRAPPQLKELPISSFIPPASLMKTLALIASSGHFTDCFISGILEVHRSKKDISLPSNYLEKTVGNSFVISGENDMMQPCSRSRNSFEIVKPVSLESQQSSGEIFPANISPGVKSIRPNIETNLAFKRVETKLKTRYDVYKNTSKYEHYLGLSTAVMTVKNVSDMFVFLSTVLNDVPDRIKSKKISSLNPPSTLLTALDILYNAEDGGCFTEAQKSTSFDSLTAQNVSDLFLTLSRTFEGLPERVKHLNVLDLDPPRSLLHAVNLLTSLPLNTVLYSKSDEEIIGDCSNGDSQEHFFDALETTSNVQCEPNSGGTAV